MSKFQTSNNYNEFKSNKSNVFLKSNIIGMRACEYEDAMNIIDGKGINTFSDELLITFFEQTMIYINTYYNKYMELYERSEKYYEICKCEIFSRFKRS